MFQPQVFQERRREVMHDLMWQHPFAILLSSATGALSADHLPFVLRDVDDGLGILQGHMATRNPLVRAARGPFEVLTIFQGPRSYVSPSWYPSKAAHGKVVPTWNYVVVQARGVLRLRREADWLLGHLDDLTNMHERARTVPWSVSDAPNDFIARQLRGLVGLEIEITELRGVWKASQNKPAEDAAGVAAGLRNVCDSESAEMAILVSQLSAQRLGTQEP